MIIIVAGSLRIKPGARDKFIEKSREAILLARQNQDCEDFAVSPDQIDSNRVNVFERWKSRSALEAFRGSGPETDIFALVEAFNVNEYEVNM